MLPRITRKTLLYKSNVEYGDFCINHAEGCSNGCRYPCYAMLLKIRCGAIKNYKDWIKPKIVGNDKYVRFKDSIAIIFVKVGTPFASVITVWFLL